MMPFTLLEKPSLLRDMPKSEGVFILLAQPGCLH